MVESNSNSKVTVTMLSNSISSDFRDMYKILIRLMCVFFSFT